MTYVSKFIRQMQLIFEQKTAAEICSTDRKFHCMKTEFSSRVLDSQPSCKHAGADIRRL